MQEEWYQDVDIPDIARILEEGVLWSADIAGIGICRWVLSGREVYVLGPGELSGWVTIPRLSLDEDHVVLCASSRLAEVNEALLAAGAGNAVMLEWNAGSSNGWVAMGSVRPTRPVAPGAADDILNVLRPAPDARISLTGGIRLTRSSWLAGHPPTIRVRGDTEAAGIVYIDGHHSTVDDMGAQVAPGWDSEGEHAITCLSGAKSYQIAAGLETWDPWHAYTWSAGDLSSHEGERPAICGMLVQPPNKGSRHRHLFTGLASNTLLLGAVPGQLYLCDSRGDLRSRTCAGYPGFEPVWALPREPLGSDKGVARILRVGTQAPVSAYPKRCRGKQQHVLRAWALAVLNATRKGLKTAPADAETVLLWAAYRKEARATWRSLR